MNSNYSYEMTVMEVFGFLCGNHPGNRPVVIDESLKNLRVTGFIGPIAPILTAICASASIDKDGTLRIERRRDAAVPPYLVLNESAVEV